MNICLVADRYLPAAGGTERHVAHLAHRLRADGHDVTVIALRHEGQPDVTVDGDIRVVRLEGWARALDRFTVTSDGSFHPTAPDPGLIRRLADVFTSSAFDLVHAHGWIVFSVAPAAKRAHLPVIVTLHDHGSVCARRTLLDEQGQICPGPSPTRCLPCASAQYGPVLGPTVSVALRASRSVLSGVDHVLAVSPSVAAAARPSGMRGAPVSVVPPYFSPGDDLPAGRPDGVPQEGRYFFYAGGVAPHKGAAIVLDAHQRLGVDVPLVVAGGSAGEFGAYDLPDGVIVAGRLEHRDTRRVMAGAVATIVPSLWPEAFGLVAVESLAVGRPVIASRVGALPDLVVDGHTGVLVEPGSRGELAGAMARLLEHPSEADRLGANGVRRASTFDAYERIVHTYRSVVDLRAGQVVLPGRP